MNDHRLRETTCHDENDILNLYKKVSLNAGSLARTHNEISAANVRNFTKRAQLNGIQYVIEALDSKEILGEIHCYKLEPKVFAHVLSELAIAVHPRYQGQELGRKLFQALLAKVANERTDILRVELIARESNTKAIAFYQSLGFEIEGKLMGRINKGNNQFEADIPMAWLNKKYTPRTRH